MPLYNATPTAGCPPPANSCLPCTVPRPFLKAARMDYCAGGGRAKRAAPGAPNPRLFALVVRVYNSSDGRRLPQ